jgi:hypothetical protein
LPGEYANPAPGLDLLYCHFCHITMQRDDEEQLSEAKLRWRHICHDICGCPTNPAAVHVRHDFRTAMSALAFRSDMQIDVPLSVLDVSLPVDRQTLMAFLLVPGFVCTATPALLSCTRVVSDFLTAIGHAVCSAPLLADCVPPVPSAAARGRCSCEYGDGRFLYFTLLRETGRPITVPRRASRWLGHTQSHTLIGHVKPAPQTGCYIDTARN